MGRYYEEGETNVDLAQSRGGKKKKIYSGISAQVIFFH